MIFFILYYNSCYISGIAPAEPVILSCEFYYEDGKVFSTPATNKLASVDLKLHKKFRFKPHFFICNETRSKEVKVMENVLIV